MLNNRLLIQQRVDVHGQNALNLLHAMMYRVFSNIQTLDADAIREKSQEINSVIEDIEFKMQEFWNFNKTASMHTWWFKNPICKCPKMDNTDALGTNVRYHNASCPLHGDK